MLTNKKYTELLKEMIVVRSLIATKDGGEFKNGIFEMSTVEKLPQELITA
eukprot:SAG11_NODE_73_length_18072_cov_8.670005_2_plen_50_part_00